MSRTLSLNARQAMFSQETDEVPILLLTITHPTTADIIRLSTDPTTRISSAPLVYGTVSRSKTFLYVGMQATLPDEKDKAPPMAQFRVSNVDRSIIPLIRSIYSPAQVLMELVLASALDDVEVEYPVLEIVSVDYAADVITFTLAMDALTSERFPGGSFDPAGFGGLFV